LHFLRKKAQKDSFCRLFVTDRKKTEAGGLGRSPTTPALKEKFGKRVFWEQKEPIPSNTKEKQRGMGVDVNRQR